MNAPQQKYTGSFVADYVPMAPKPGKKMAGIKDNTGNWWNVFPSELTRISKGDTVACIFTQSDNGGKFVESVQTINGAVPAPPPSPTAGQAAQQAMPMQQMPQQFDERNPPPPMTQAEADMALITPIAQTNGHDKEENMFVMGVVGRALGSGQFGVAEIPELARQAVYAWRTRNEPPVAQ